MQFREIISTAHVVLNMEEMKVRGSVAENHSGGRIGTRRRHYRGLRGPFPAADNRQRDK